MARRKLPAFLILGSLLLLGICLGAINAINPWPDHAVEWQALFGLASTILIVIEARRGTQGGLGGTGIVLALSFAACCILAVLSAGSFANSGDENSYLFLTDTLLHGRLWNQPPPVPALFDAAWIAVRDGKWISQYSPGWSALLVPFRAVGLEQLANPLLTLLMGVALAGALRCLDVSRPVMAGLTALVMLSPFVLFNGASFFNHTLTGCLVMLICWLQLWDEKRPAGPGAGWGGGWAAQAGIGACFSLLLATRTEVFAVMAALFVADRVWLQRLACVRGFIAAAAGALPITLLFLAYNRAITGNPFTLTMNWAIPGAATMGFGIVGDTGLYTPAMAARFVVDRTAALLEFASPLLLAAYAWALVRRARGRSLRFYDLVLPGAILFFVFFPNAGGHQYGPRYWFFGWPPVALSVGAALAKAEFRAAGSKHLPLYLDAWRLALPRAALCQVAVYLGVTLSFGVFLRSYFDARREVLSVAPPDVPAVVLVPGRLVVLGPWQRVPFVALASDFTRNGVDFNQPVLFGNGSLPQAAALACTVPNHFVYQWRGPGRLERVAC